MENAEGNLSSQIDRAIDVDLKSEKGAQAQTTQYLAKGAQCVA